MSLVAWLGYSTEDEHCEREMIRLFDEPETQDALRLGQVREVAGGLRVAHDAALAASGDMGEFSPPYWVFPGAAKIERHVLPYPLSRDRTRYEQLKGDLAIYRLAFGQPRQEDMLELLERRGTKHAPEPLNQRPPGLQAATQPTTSSGEALQ